ncbi:Lysophospholipase L1 [Actinacidiphila alni]|uniref:Lysophospholipase L1 n=1 Tax=Actinacidiphila alni TaxID=380248 RepID=A0A1I2LN07_9ACTN|nr:ricin-type beta-trefoil lectin domain protein [Actinacidiphila alni]SFF79840.1 Lysophospholipase L1 [Actinacidiphila alni]
MRTAKFTVARSRRALVSAATTAGLVLGTFTGLLLTGAPAQAAPAGSTITGPGGTCVDVSGDDIGVNGAAVQLWACQPQAFDQHWTRGANGSLTVLGRCLDINGNGTAAGTKVELWDCNGVGGQNWQQRANGSLFNPQSGRCLDSPSGATANGTRLQIWDCNGSAAQQFRIGAATGESNGGVLIMPLGDSITDGFNVPGGYRSDLWQYLAADGHTDDFVGSQSNGPARLGDHDHEGHPGWRIDEIDAHAAAWVRATSPRTILLHIGTNDMTQNYDPAGAPARLSTLLTHITDAAPGADVLVSDLIPLADPTLESRAEQYNAAVPGVVSALAAQGRHVHFVSMHTALTTADLADGVHPTAGGYSKMAARWYAALISSPVTRWEAENPAYATVHDADLPSSPTASGGVKAGHIDNADSYLQYTITAPYTGAYRMYVRGGNGMGTTCTHLLTVNGGSAVTVSYPAYGWDEWSMTGVDVQLQQGANTVRFAKGACYAEIDAIDFATLGAPTPWI